MRISWNLNSEGIRDINYDGGYDVLEGRQGIVCMWNRFYVMLMFSIFILLEIVFLVVIINLRNQHA